MKRLISAIFIALLSVTFLPNSYADTSYQGTNNIINPGWATWWPTPEQAGQTYYDNARATNLDDCGWTAMRIDLNGGYTPLVRFESYMSCTSTLKQWVQYLYVWNCPDGELNNTYTGVCEPNAPPITKPVKTLGQPTCDSVSSSVGDN